MNRTRRPVTPESAAESARDIMRRAHALAGRCLGAAHHSSDPLEAAMLAATARQADRAAALLADACPPIPALTPAAGTVGALASTSHP